MCKRLLYEAHKEALHFIWITKTILSGIAIVNVGPRACFILKTKRCSSYCLLRELRTKLPSQILLNFCIALSLMLIVFLVSSKMPENSPVFGCRAVAIALHYFLLAAFLWMAVEGLNMYLAFVKVFPYLSPSKFMSKCCLFAWGNSF